MKIVLDSKGNIVHINKTIKGGVYYCQICNQELMQRRCEIKAHHFEHYSPHGEHANYVPCPDKWDYDMSDWHYDWQEQFDYNIIEIVVTYGETKHVYTAEKSINSLIR